MNFNKIISSVPSPVYYCLVILFVGLLVFNRTFQLSLMGDELQMIWVIKGSIETTGQWDFGIKQFHWQGYQFGAFLMHLLTEYFGTDGRAVYISSFITRFLAASALFYFLKKRGISNFSSFIGSLLFMVTPIGLQATDWAKNLTSYISIIFFIFCIDLIFDLKSLWRIPVFLLTFAASIYVNPIRAHGIIFIAAFLLLFQLFFNKSINKKTMFISLFGSLGFILLFSKMMVFGNADQFQSDLIQRFALILGQFNESNLHRLEDLFVLIGKGVLPKPSLVYVVLLITLLLLWKNYLFNKKYLLFTLLLNIVFFIFLFNLHKSNDEITKFAGIYFTIFSSTIFLVELFNKKISESMITILPFILNISFILIPWIFGNTDITESTHRYLIYPALSLPIIAANVLNQYRFKYLNDLLRLKLSSIPFAIVAFLLIMFILSIKKEINKMYLQHNQNTVGIIWQQIYPYFDSLDFKNHRPILLFESDNAEMLHGTVLFGVDYRLGIRYKIWEEKKLPIPLDELKTLKSMLIDGKASKRYLGEEIVFPKEDAFYFKIEGNKVTRIDIPDSLINN